MKMLAGLIVGLMLGGVGFGQGAGTSWMDSTGIDLGTSSGRRPMTFTDLQRFKRIGDPQISASGKWVMFSAVDVDLAANTKVNHLWVVPLGGGQEKQVTFWKEGENDGRFSPDGKQVAFVATDGATGQSQIFLATWNESTGTLGTPKQLTNVSTETRSGFCLCHAFIRSAAMKSPG
jgi:Tol biopolymer transport system component